MRLDLNVFGRLTVLVVLRRCRRGCLLPCEKNVASASSREQMPLTAWVATLNGLRLEHSAKLNPDRSVSHSTAWIGSRAELDARWLLRRWLKSESPSIPVRISTMAVALCGANNLRTSITGVIAKHSRNSCMDPLQSAGSLVSTEGSPWVIAALSSPMRNWLKNSKAAFSPIRNWRRWSWVFKRCAIPALSVN